MSKQLPLRPLQVCERGQKHEGYDGDFDEGKEEEIH
jgi:hypothetical protein